MLLCIYEFTELIIADFDRWAYVVRFSLYFMTISCNVYLLRCIAAEDVFMVGRFD
jgi:hypothetical protein